MKCEIFFRSSQTEYRINQNDLITEFRLTSFLYPLKQKHYTESYQVKAVRIISHCMSKSFLKTHQKLLQYPKTRTMSVSFHSLYLSAKTPVHYTCLFMTMAATMNIATNRTAAANPPPILAASTSFPGGTSEMKAVYACTKED